MAEAEFVLKPDFDITKAEAKINKLKREFEDSKRKAEEIKDGIKNTENEIVNCVAKQKELNEEMKKLPQSSEKELKLTENLEKAKLKAEEAAQKVEHINNALIDSDDKIEKISARNKEINDFLQQGTVYGVKKENLEKELAKNEQKVNSEVEKNIKLQEQLITQKNNLENSERNVANLEKQIADEHSANIERHTTETNAKLVEQEQLQKKLESTLQKQNNALAKQNGQTATIGEKIAVSTKKTNKFVEAFKKSEKSAARFGKRLKSIALSALFFSLVTKALTALREQFGKMITEQGTKTAELAAKLKGGLSVIGTTLYESAKPAIEWILNALLKMVNILANGLAKILGKDINEMKKLAKQTKKTGEEAKKATAGFDTLQTIDTSSNSSSSSDSGVSADFSSINDKVDGEMVALMAIISGALLVLGVILCFTGVAVPLGLGLIATGAALLATAVIPNWDSLSPKTKKSLMAILFVVSTLLLVIGIILVCSGVGLPLGIALIVAGAAGLVAVVALNWNKIKDTVKSVFEKIKTFVSGWGILVLGILLCFSGVGIALGISLILKGASNLTKQKDPLWNSILNKIKEIWGKIKSWWDTHVSQYFTVKYWADKVKNILNGIGNKITNSKVGKFFGNIGSSVGNGIKNLFTTQSVTASTPSVVNSTGFQVPALATGAVLPGGSPMLAWVNDQPKGHGYIEGSIDNIAAAFEKYLGNHNFSGNQNLTVEATGNWSQFMRFMRLQLKEEDNRASIH